MAVSPDAHTYIEHFRITTGTNRNTPNTAIYHSRLFVFMSPLSGPSLLLNCVLTHCKSIMLSDCGHKGKCNMMCDWVCVCVFGVQYTSFWDIWAVRHQSSMSGLASHTTNGSFMTSVSSLRDHNAIKQHATLNRKQPVASLARWRFDTSDLDFQ